MERIRQTGGTMEKTVMVPLRLVAGIDTHKEVHRIAVMDSSAKVVDGFSVAATGAGYRACARRLGRLGVSEVAIEGCTSWGKGLADHLSSRGFEVVEALKPGRRPFAQAEKTDASDAERAALCALWHMGLVPKDTKGAAGRLAPMLAAREAAVANATRLSNCARSMLDTAPDALRERYRAMTTPRTMHALAKSRPREGDGLAIALRALARLWVESRKEADALEASMGAILQKSNPRLLGAYGVGVVCAAKLVVLAGDNPERFGGEAAFAKACGACPIPASSGKTDRHRLNRGGDRRANNALHQIALSRMKGDERTRAYVERRSSEGKEKREIKRCLVRYIAREAYRAIMADAKDAQSMPLADVSEPEAPMFRERREELGLTLAEVSAPLESNPTALSRLERSLSASPALRKRYGALLDRLEAGETLVEIAQNAPLQR